MNKSDLISDLYCTLVTPTQEMNAQPIGGCPPAAAGGPWPAIAAQRAFNRRGGAPAPQAVIPPARRSYAQAAAFSPLEGADWVYVESGEAAKPCTGGQVQRPLQGAGAQQQGMEGPGYKTRN